MVFESSHINALLAGKNRRIACALSLLAALVLMAMSQSRSGAQIALDARIGFGQSALGSSRYRADTWTPITVYLTGQSVRGTGQISVTVHHGNLNTVYTRRVSLNEGPINETYSFAFDYPPSNQMFGMGGGAGAPEVIAQLVLDGRELAKKKFALPLPILDDTYNLLALTKDGSGLNFLVKRKLGLTHKGVPQASAMRRYGGNAVLNNGANNPSFSNIKSQLPPIELLYTDPRALPEMTQGYAMLDAIALGDQPLDNLKEGQLEAIKGYVREGGLLIISGGGDLSRLKSQFYTEMLPIVPGGAVNVRNSPELSLMQTRYQTPLEISSGVSLTTGSLKPDASVLIGSTKGTTGFGLVASRPYGNGVVVFTAFDYLSPEFRGWSKASSLWQDLLRTGNNAVSPIRVLRQASANRAYGTSLGLADALAGKQATNIPPFSLVAFFLGTYIVLLVPVSYLILKKMDKREFAWISSPILIIGFTIASYLIALSIKGGELTVNRAVIVEGQANCDSFAGYGQMTLYSPRRADYSIAFSPSGDASRPFRSVVPAEAYANEVSPSNLHIEHDQVASIKDANIPLWDKRSFDTSMAVDLGGQISVSAEMINDVAANLTVTNRSKYAIHECAIVNADNQSLQIGELAPGQTWKSPTSIAWSYKGTGTVIHMPETKNIDPVDPTKKKETPEELQAHIRTRLKETLISPPTQQQYYGVGDADGAAYGHVSNAFIGWLANTGSPLLNVQVDGKTPAGQEVALLYLRLPAPKNANSKIQGVTNPFQLQPDLEILTEQNSFKGSSIPGSASGE